MVRPRRAQLDEPHAPGGLSRHDSPSSRIASNQGGCELRCGTLDEPHTPRGIAAVHGVHPVGSAATLGFISSSARAKTLASLTEPPSLLLVEYQYVVDRPGLSIGADVGHGRDPSVP